MKLFEFYNRKVFIVSAAFIALFWLFEIIFFGQYRNSAIEYLEYAAATDFWWKYLILAAGIWFLSIISLLSFFYVSFISPLIFRIFYFLLFTLITLFEYSYQSVYGRFSITDDLKIAFLTTSAQRLDAVFAYFNWVALLPCAVYSILLLTVNLTAKLSIKKASAVSIIFFAAVSLSYLTLFFAAPRITAYSFYDNSFGSNNKTFYAHLFLKIFSLPDQRRKVSIPENVSAPQNNIVVVVDESTRGDHLSLNGYERPTTPYLESLNRRGLIFNWKIAASASTRSLESFQYLITGITADDLTDISNKTLQMPTVFQYAKAMGYKTFYFDGQLNDYWGGAAEDLKSIDEVEGVETINPQHQPDYDNDFKIAQKVNRLITDSSGNFIFIFKHGNHVPYVKNFPPDKAVWLPVSNADPPHQLADFDQKAFVNAYDDGIKYNLDEFFQTLAPDYQNLPNKTVIVYTGDHGQTLSENGENYPHGGRTVKEASVPLLMFGNFSNPIDTTFRASHANIFPTLLDLMNYPSDLRKYKYAVSLLKATGADSKDRYFIAPNNGGGLIFDKNSRVKFD